MLNGASAGGGAFQARRCEKSHAEWNCKITRGIVNSQIVNVMLCQADFSS